MSSFGTLVTAGGSLDANGSDEPSLSDLLLTCLAAGTVSPFSLGTLMDLPREILRATRSAGCMAEHTRLE